MAAKLLFLVGALLSHQVAAQMSPTEQLNAQRQAQMRQQMLNQQAANNARRVQTRRLAPPCVVPESYYPLRTCAVTTSASVCGRGWNAWPTFGECCQPGQRGAFPQGCTDFSKEVQCWIPDKFYPEQTCMPTKNITRCSFNWGTWSNEASCCQPGAAHPEGCSRLQSQCWVATEWSPSRKCSLISDAPACARGWGAYASEYECCEPGGGFAEGCLDYDAGSRDGLDDDNTDSDSGVSAAVLGGSERMVTLAGEVLEETPVVQASSNDGYAP